jgi:hypothetical protein
MLGQLVQCNEQSSLSRPLVFLMQPFAGLDNLLWKFKPQVHWPNDNSTVV